MSKNYSNNIPRAVKTGKEHRLVAKLKLHRSQANALKLVARYALRHRAEALREIKHVLKMTNVPPALFEAAQREIFRHARAALHFHPDRPCRNGKSAAQNLLADGVYKSQFETFLSAGSVSAHKGGLRYKLEKRLFHNAYNKWGVKAEHRPKYGALDLTLQADGPSPRFGSCFFLLNPKTLKRCTFTYLDSFTFPKAKGTSGEFQMIFAALLKDLFQHRAALGKKDVTVREFLASLLENLGKPYPDPSLGRPSRNLDNYIEVQVHGEVSLAKDCELLIADPSFRGTATGEVLQELAALYNLKLAWHMGFALPVEEVPKDFRGPEMPPLAKRISRGGVVTTEMIGRAAFDLFKQPSNWAELGTYEETLQKLKLLWHVLLYYGKPLASVSVRE